MTINASNTTPQAASSPAMDARQDGRGGWGSTITDAPVRHQASRVRVGRNGVCRHLDMRAWTISVTPPGPQLVDDPFDQGDMRRAKRAFPHTSNTRKACCISIEDDPDQVRPQNGCVCAGICGPAERCGCGPRRPMPGPLPHCSRSSSRARDIVATVGGDQLLEKRKAPTMGRKNLTGKEKTVVRARGASGRRCKLRGENA